MNHKLLVCIRLGILLLFTGIRPVVAGVCNEPDSAYVFAYSTDKNDNHNGLHFAWSIDAVNWHPVGPEFQFMRSFYGRWGPQKKMFDPYIFQDKEGWFHCVFSVNEEDNKFAYSVSPDLITWKSQDFPAVPVKTNCMAMEIGVNPESELYQVSWLDTKSNQYYTVTTSNILQLSDAKQIAAGQRKNDRREVIINGVPLTGTIHKVKWPILDGIIKKQELSAYKTELYAEYAKDDATRFAGLEEIRGSLSVIPEKSKAISNMLIGIFFEDINYAADGGLYAELIQNRDFEYSPDDKEGKDENWNATTSWSVKGTGLTFSIDTKDPIHPNNPHYAVLEIHQPGSALVNEGWDGIAVKAGEKYDFSAFIRTPEGAKGKVLIRLTDEQGQVVGETSLKTGQASWKKQESTLTARSTVTNTRLEIIPEFSGKIELDMISLFPRNTFKGRKNGLRTDLAQVLADIKPKFVRFPGGCVAHGDGLGNIYRWVNTVGPLESRVPQRNLWGYHQTAGLGYYEYFQFCEDIGAQPVPVVAAGVPCQNSGVGGHGQQCGIPMDEMNDYIQELFDLIEFANGSIQSKWGKVRAEMGHPKPFNLKYLGVGNEDLISEVFIERFEMICNAFREKHPEISIIGTSGPFHEGSDYEAGWEVSTRMNIPLVDEHYYLSPAWYIYNQDYYDKYDRNKPKVYLGEYAAHLPDRSINIESALAEALHLINLERNGDVVYMSSYAPLLAKENRTQWNPDLIYFNNTEIKPTVGYYVQKLWGNHAGDTYIPHVIQLSSEKESVRKRVATSVVRDSKTGDLIIKMVNLLPETVNLNLDIEELVKGTQAFKVILQGTPEDKTAKPNESLVPLEEVIQTQLPPYSLTIYRLQ
ncbi:MAG: carbohydrate binding domain-containing protein [Tannerellaceae bacterium]|nr:carbohydrate binding domain-containing protein [Tannerellaceae bacterium]